MRVHLHCRAQFSTSGTSFPKLNLFPKLLKSYSDPTDDFEATGDSGLSLGPARLLLHKEAYRAWETLFGVTRSPDVCRSHPLAAPRWPPRAPQTFPRTLAVHAAGPAPASRSGAQDQPHALLTCPPNAAPKSLPSRPLSAPVLDPAAKRFLLHGKTRSRDVSEAGARTASPEGPNSARCCVRALYGKT